MDDMVKSREHPSTPGLGEDWNEVNDASFLASDHQWDLPTDGRQNI